ncbi:MAG: VTT domain-containing protein [Candidatus Micrarchaeota archaeon]
MNEKTRSLLALLLALAITSLLLFFSANIPKLDSLGYAGAFLISFFTSATVILPVPGLAVVAAMGAFLNPVLIGILGGLGSALGELTGYLAGYGGRGLAGNSSFVRVSKWVEKNGFLTIFLLALIPNPLFDIAGIAAGSLRYDWKKFLLACALGKILKFTLFAYLGNYGGMLI